MTSFENFLISKGYLKFRLNAQTMRFERAADHTISTMINLDHRYFPSTDTNILNKINEGQVIGEGITFEDRKNEICFGLNESNKPPTLISPKPNLGIKKTDKEGKTVYYFIDSDDIVNRALATFTNEQIFDSIINGTKLTLEE